MSTDIKLTTAEWVRSSYSDGDGGECVEFSRTFARDGVIPVRDSKHPHGPILAFPANGWTSLVTTLKHGTTPHT